MVGAGNGPRLPKKGLKKAFNYQEDKLTLQLNLVTENMGKKEKLLNRFLSIPKDFTWEELTRLLKSFGYIEVNSGKTGGSRRKFHKKNSSHFISLHKPHPKNELKRYAIEQVIEVLKKENLI